MTGTLGLKLVVFGFQLTVVGAWGDRITLVVVGLLPSLLAFPIDRLRRLRERRSAAEAADG